MAIQLLPSDARMIGQSQAIKRVESELDCAARSDAKVLITGETGVGKEVVARLIHQRSARVRSPLVSLNCAGFPDSLLESELFGHVRGSFTGAYRDKQGILETSPAGTVFLDEVAEMSSRMQVVLLRFLETGEIQRVGADRPHRRVNVRIITATNRDLQAQISAGSFREDLYFRLHVIHLHIPPLRERVEDIPLLVNYYAGVFAESHQVGRSSDAMVTSEAMDTLTKYAWPGNIRELKNALERMVLQASGSPIRFEHLPANIRSSVKPAPGTPAGMVGASRADELMAAMLDRRESFWSAVYPLFMARDLTRTDLRRLVQLGLERTNGSYRLLVELFNLPADDYKRLLNFLRKHDCHLAFQQFRALPGRYPAADVPLRAVGA